jgi:hypothetical protein
MAMCGFIFLDVVCVALLDVEEGKYVYIGSTTVVALSSALLSCTYSLQIDEAITTSIP